MSELKKYALVAVIAAGLGALVTRLYYPKIEQKIVVKEKAVEQTNVRTVTRTVEVPGRKETVVETVDNSTKTVTTQATKTVTKRTDWILGVSAGAQLSSLDLNYTLTVDRRILGPVFAGAYGRTDGELGLSLRLEF